MKKVAWLNFVSDFYSAWLRGRRQVPPTEEEVLRNKAIADMKKVNAAELDKEYHPEKAIAPPKREESSTVLTKNFSCHFLFKLLII